MNSLLRANTQLPFAFAPRHPKRANPAGIAGLALLDVIADIPDRAIVARINRRLRVILPAHDILCACAGNWWLIGSDCAASKRRHYDQPTIRELIVAHDRIAVVRRFARAAEAFEDGVVRHGAIQDFALLVENRHPRVDGLHHVIRSDGETVVRRVAQIGRALRACKANA